MLRHAPCWMLMFVLLAAGCGGAERDRQVAQLRVEDFRYVQRSDGARVLRGTLVNPSPEAVANVQIEVSLLDGDNRRVATALIAVEEVPGEGSVPFRKILSIEERVQSARIRAVRGV